MLMPFLDSKYKQFDGEKGYCNFSCNIGILQTRALNRPKELQLAFKIQLLDKIHCCTEISVNLLLNTCNFCCKSRLIFELILPYNAPNVHFREAKFQNFRGVHFPVTP